MRYEFQQQDAYGIARHIRIETRQRGDELQFKTCPYCQGGKHGKDAWTFSINLSNGQNKCLRDSCGIQGNMITLSRDFDFRLSKIEEYINPPRYKKLKQPDRPIEPKDEAIEYLKGRGISEQIARRYQITVRKDNSKAIVFPFMDDKGIMQFIKYRKTDFNPEKDNNKEWCHAKCRPILFGMAQCNLENKTLILTEGQIDSLSVAEAGIENAVSVPTGAKGFTWVPNCWQWLQGFDKLIVFGDCEHGRITLLEDMKKRFSGVVMAVQESDYQGCKDANELLQKCGKGAVKTAVDNAQPIPVRQVIDLADVAAVDLYSIPKIPTGIQSIDKVLSGGMYAGQTIILTGKRGDGKSTLGSQILVNALEAGKNIFAYSGELPDYFFKRWLDMQAAGKYHVIERHQDDGTTSTYVTKSTIDKIASWYRGRAFLFDNNVAEDDELEDLLKVAEKTIQQYGVELVLIDNLMTALDVSMSTDIYRAQSKFVDKLVKLSKRLGVVIILVAHPRKNRFVSDDNDEIAGSSDIVNKADIVMTYRRDNDLPEDERLLTVSKNRLTGRLAVGDRAIRLYYDERSKRISDKTEDFDKAYSWQEVDEQGFMELESDTPFDD